MQLASISQDPWFSRVGSAATIDHIAMISIRLTTCPSPACSTWRDGCATSSTPSKAPGFAKTSGSGGLHIYVPMPPRTPYEAGFIYAQIVATMVAADAPEAGHRRAIAGDEARRIYVDYMQNSRGKTLASAYSARANNFAGVSTPLTWEEVERGRDAPRISRCRPFAARLETVGDVLGARCAASEGRQLRCFGDAAAPRDGAGRSEVISMLVRAPVAQLDRAPDFESVGRRFESCRARHPACEGHGATERLRSRAVRYSAPRARRARDGVLRQHVAAAQVACFTDACRSPHAPVAQLDRALASGAKGRRFESCRAYQPPLIDRAEVVHHSSR